MPTTRHHARRGGKLCSQCSSKINIEAMLRRQGRFKEERHDFNLGPIDAWSSETCSLCGMLARLLSKEEPGDRFYLGYKPDDLRPFDGALLTLYKPIPARRRTEKKIIAELIITHETSQWVRLIRPHFSPSVIISWLDFCYKYHDCDGMGTRRPTSIQNSSPPESLYSIRTFKLIDCETRCIIRASPDVVGKPFVALSYVWGVGPAEQLNGTALPSHLPTTIEDSVTVTRQLGLRYLWVDRYCIDQNNVAEKAEQIPKMDLIYANAAFTIVAVAGRDPHFGLPGVKSRVRKTQYHVGLGQFFLAEGLPDTMQDIAKSTWSTRGWTFQEGLLSPRRVVFTEHQVYFECQNMYCRESFNFPLERLHTPNLETFRPFLLKGANLGAFPRRVEQECGDVTAKIEQYSRKFFQDPSDILNGFLGIFHALEAGGRFKVRHCFGVPEIPLPSEPTSTDLHLDRKQLSELTRIHKSRRWTPVIGLCYGLCWSARRSRRRPGFPSWSWTGWIGAITWFISHGGPGWKLMQGEENISIKVELDNGEVESWNNIEGACADIHSRIKGNILHIEALVCRIRVTGYMPTQYRHYYNTNTDLAADVWTESGELYFWSFTPHAPQQIDEPLECIGVQLARDLLSPPSQYCILVAKKVKGDLYERLGFGVVTDKTAFDRQAKVENEMEVGPPGYKAPKLSMYPLKFRLS